jgi:hypothetical protein
MKSKNYPDELQNIPGVGPSIARDLHDLGYTSVARLKGADPESMYQALCQIRGTKIDRCVLYTFRCAVYFARSKKPSPEKLKWWNWRDKPEKRKTTRS